MTRKLATIQVISSIEKHPNADKLEIANVLGWRIIIGKGEFKEGDKIVYFETDSVLPEIPEFEFLRDRCFVNNGIVKGFRLKMIRLRGEFSQGLIMPLSILDGKKFPNDIRENPIYDWKEGQEVTGLIGVKLFEKPIPVCMRGDIKGPFPSFLHVTDETRIQLLGSLLKEYEGTKCYISEKIDGTSTTMFYNKGEFGVCSRNYELKPDTRTFHETPPLVKVNDKIYLSNDNGEAVGEPIESLPNIKENVYWKMARKYNIEEKLRKLGKNIAIQGESFGEGLQGNPLKIKDQRLAIFNVFDIDKNEYYSLDEMINFCNELGLETVPILDKEYILESDIQKIVKMSIGNSVINSECKREGIVIRPVENKIDKRYFNECVNGRISFKVINPEYALNEE
jgi:RNA ligase (TIGR02306 family)